VVEFTEDTISIKRSYYKLLHQRPYHEVKDFFANLITPLHYNMTNTLFFVTQISGKLCEIKVTYSYAHIYCPPRPPNKRHFKL